MTATNFEIIAALRMLFSTNNSLISVMELSNPTAMIDSAELLVKNEYCSNESEVMEIQLSEFSNKEKALKIESDWSASNSTLPRYVAVSGTGSFAIGKCPADNISSISKKVIPVEETENRRLENKVVIITGGAQGFGAGLAEHFFQWGSNVIIGDLNEDAGQKLADAFNEKNLPNRALFVKANVAELDSVNNLVEETIAHFGGIDVMISNAGILRAGGLDEMTPEDFDLMTKVNYSGYFNCAKAASKYMKIQAEYSDEHFFDILQINSKSGLKGSNKNFAYAGGKFGGIGLTQSFALELMPHRIKVNSICPGNFFDGPLWSDPEKGLFVQYLKAGKVPGATSIEDVKKHYESQVPAGRGCGTLDVARAAVYAIEQEYETGQAIPVTGGQNMLH